jgi:hypothetical protein
MDIALEMEFNRQGSRCALQPLIRESSWATLYHTDWVYPQRIPGLPVHRPLRITIPQGIRVSRCTKCEIVFCRAGAHPHPAVSVFAGFCVLIAWGIQCRCFEHGV